MLEFSSIQYAALFIKNDNNTGTLENLFLTKFCSFAEAHDRLPTAAYSLDIIGSSRRVMRREIVIGWNYFPLAVVTPFEFRQRAMLE